MQEPIKKKGGKHLFVKGESGNPAGKPKGLLNKIPQNMKARVLAAAEALDAAGKSLAEEALKEPKWFWDTFGKAMLPKDINLSGDVKNHILVKVEFVRPQIDTDSTT